MKVAIIATDLDGTFLRDDHQFDHPRFQAQLDQMNAQGQHFVVAETNYSIVSTFLMAFTAS